MPAEDDYGQRRQVLLHHGGGGGYLHAAAACPAGCAAPTAPSTDRLLQYKECSDRGSGYHGHSTDRLHRYTQPPDRYGVGSLDRYERVLTPAASRSLDRYATIDRFQQKEPAPQPNCTSNQQERYERYRYQIPDQYQSERYNCERYDRVPTYIPPPSPAPASDRFIPPPPLSPATTPSPDCYPSQPFPSPTAATTTERFIPPPPLSPSPTEKFSPKPDRFNDNKNNQQRQYQQQQYHAHQYQLQPQENHQRYQCYGNERYHQPEQRYLPPTAHTPVERYVPQPQEPYYQQQYPQNQYERYASGKWQSSGGSDPYMRRDLGSGAGYPHHYRLPAPPQLHYQQRLRYTSVGTGTPARAKCCPYQDYQLSRASPGSSSSSSVASQGRDTNIQASKDSNVVAVGQCFHPVGSDNQAVFPVHEKAVQCVQSYQITQTPPVRTTKHAPCPSPGIEYVGQSGGRHVCQTPPPPRTAAAEQPCADQCCVRRPQHTTLLW